MIGDEEVTSIKLKYLNNSSAVMNETLSMISKLNLPKTGLKTLVLGLEN